MNGYYDFFLFHRWIFKKRIKLGDVLLLSMCLLMDYMLELNSLAFVINIKLGSRHELFVVKFFVVLSWSFYYDSNQYQPSQSFILLDYISLEIWLVSIRHMSEYVLLPLCYILMVWCCFTLSLRRWLLCDVQGCQKRLLKMDRWEGIIWQLFHRDFKLQH